MTNGSNSEADKKAALQQAKEFGQREGSGSAARAGFYYTLTEFAKDKRMDVADAQVAWEAFYNGASSGAAMIGGVKDLAEDIKKVRVSECRKFLTFGGLPLIDPVEVMGRAMAIIKVAKQNGALKGKATDAMLAVARAQCKDPNNPLEDGTIEDVIQPKVGADKVEADALNPLRDRLEAVMKKFEESDEILEAIHVIDKRIADLGGTTATQKANAAAQKKANKNGKKK